MRKMVPEKEKKKKVFVNFKKLKKKFLKNETIELGNSQHEVSP